MVKVSNSALLKDLWLLILDCRGAIFLSYFFVDGVAGLSPAIFSQTSSPVKGTEPMIIIDHLACHQDRDHDDHVLFEPYDMS